METKPLLLYRTRFHVSEGQRVLEKWTENPLASVWRTIGMSARLALFRGNECVFSVIRMLGGPNLDVSATSTHKNLKGNTAKVGLAKHSSSMNAHRIM